MAGFSRAIEKVISPRDKFKIFLMALPHELACKRLNTRTKQGKIGIASILIYLGTALLSGALMAECL